LVPPSSGPPAAPQAPNPQQADAAISGAVAKASNALRQALLQLAPPDAAGDPLAAQKLELERLKLEAGQKDEDRKAYSQANQNQVELIRLKEQMSNDAEERRNAIEKAQLDLQREQVRAEAMMKSAAIQHVVAPMMSPQPDEAAQHQVTLQSAAMDLAKEHVKARAQVQSATLQHVVGPTVAAQVAHPDAAAEREANLKASRLELEKERVKAAAAKAKPAAAPKSDR
jgi:hypothetical protein